MSLSCYCDNGPDAKKTIYRTARKQHKCCECRAQIAVGQKYEYISGIWDGRPSSFHTCEKCADLRDSMTELGYCVTFGGLKNDHADYINER